MIEINSNIGIPKYKQIVVSIENAITNGALKKGDQIPSINAIRDTHHLSRDTVIIAFNELKSRGIIQSVVGKGYYVSSENVSVKKKVLLLFDELNSFKEDLYNSFINNLDEDVQVDIYFHHFNINVFNKIVEDNIGNYNHYIIMPANLKNTSQILSKLPKDKVYILDQMPKDLKSYPGIFQNFEKDIYTSLNNAYKAIAKYSKLILVFSNDRQPIDMRKGFLKFCKYKSINHDVINTLKNRALSKGELYIIPDDKNLLRIIKRIKENKLLLSKDIGIISYNDTLLKEVVEGGITTISTDFNSMGKQLAEIILNNENKLIENPSHLILRHSL